MAELDDTQKAVCKAITERAENAAATPEDLERLANAVAHLKFGPQGGDLNRTDDYHYTADYHYTEHDRDRRQRPTGFGRTEPVPHRPDPTEIEKNP